MFDKSIKILGVDYGSVRTGISVSTALGTATGVKTIKSKGLHELAGLIAEEAKEKDCKLIVIGLPKNMDGSEGEKCETVRLLGQYIKECVDIDIDYCDERMSTMEAHRYLNMTNTKGDKRKAVVDTLAAELILQSYLDMKKNS